MNFGEGLKLAMELSEPILVIVGVVVGIAAKKHASLADLQKTLHAADDAIEIIKGEHEGGKKHDELSAGKRAVDLVKEIRGHKIGKKLERKVRARVKARLGGLLKKD